MRIFTSILATAILFAAQSIGSAQRPPAQLDSSAILHRLQKLEVLGSVLYIAAHPDDENTRLISYLSNGRKVRTAYLSLTRGDGGQNLIGSELGAALGILRTQELLEARRIDGGEQFFTRAVDFGYSKNPEETFEKWGPREVLGDVVRVLRTFRPDVIITRFSTDGSGTHGHHTASALLAHEAFDLAADPSQFPEQIEEGLDPWQAKRLFFNAYSWTSTDHAAKAKADPANWVVVDVGGYDPLLGQSYGEIAGRSRSMHKSQGFGAAETRGEQFEYLHFEKGAKLEKPDIFDGVELSYARIEGGERAQELLRELVRGFDMQAPEKCIENLSALARALDVLSDSKSPQRGWAKFQAENARQLLLQACGAVIQATSDRSRVAQGDKLRISLSSMRRRPGVDLEISGVMSLGVTTVSTLQLNRPSVVESEYWIPDTQAVDEPFWLSKPHGFLYQTGSLISGIQPVSRMSWIERTLRLPEGMQVVAGRPLMQVWVDRVAGERTREVVVTPVASIEIADPVAIVRGEHATVSVEIESLTDNLTGTLRVSAPDGWQVEPATLKVEALARGQRRRSSFDLLRAPEADTGVMRLAFRNSDGRRSDKSMHVIDYPHILPQTWYTPAEIKLVPLDVAVSVKTVGYIDGAGDDVPKALQQLGLVVNRIDPANAHAEDLDKCDAIITGIRAYNSQKALARFNPMLLDYVERGGTLVVQYNTSGSDLVMDAKKLGPYPFSLTRDRVTVEEAPATFLDPTHPLLNIPNKLGPADFEGWVQERGLYFTGEQDPKYAALIAWNDPGEKPAHGALIACDHGKGRYVYTGISLFRQLPAGVPGAYRLLANLLARRAPRE